MGDVRGVEQAAGHDRAAVKKRIPPSASVKTHQKMLTRIGSFGTSVKYSE